MANNSDPLPTLDLNQLIGDHCHDVLIRERWVFGERRGECEAIYLHLDSNRWVVISVDEENAAWVMYPTTADRAHQAERGGDSHYRLRDATKDFSLAALRIENIKERKLEGKIELCLEFSNATDLTVHFNLITGDSSLYFIKD